MQIYIPLVFAVNIFVLALANLIGGLFIIGYNVSIISEYQPEANVFCKNSKNVSDVFLHIIAKY